MPSRSPFRIAAPGALLAVVVVVFLVLQSGSEDGTGTTTPAAKTATTSAKHLKRSTYTVRVNDNLSSIAQRYGLTVEQLRELNPNVDPEAIHKGQRLRLRK